MNHWSYIGLFSVILLAVSNLWLIYRVLNPLRCLAAQMTDITKGDLTALQQPCGGIPEIEVLRRSMASMAGHVRRTHDERIAYHTALTNGQEAERSRIAHELHDDTVQALVAISQSIELARNWISEDPARAISMLELARTQAVETVTNLRRLIANLRPPMLDELGLVPALRMLTEDQSVRIPVTLTVRGAERRIDSAQELAMFRGAQEAIRNAQRHSQAEHIRVEVVYKPSELQLLVQDDGIGFALPDSLGHLASDGHYGLLGIQERLEFLKGSAHIASILEKGTTIKLTLPLDSSNQPTEAVRDPVCGAVIKPKQVFGSSEYEGKRYYFCCPVCQGAFQKEPQLYLSTHA